MPSAGAIRAGRAYVEVSANGALLDKGLKQAERRLKAFGASVREMGAKLVGLGSAIMAPLLASSKVFADVGSELNDMSARTGISAQSLSELGYAAKLSGTDLAGLEGGVRKMQKAIVSAASGSEEAQHSLALLGLSVADLKALNPEQQFSLIADRLSKIPNATMRAAVAMQVFGKSGTALLPMLADGADGLERMRREARDLGLSISNEDAKSADEFGDTLDRLWMVLKRGTFAIGAAVAPVLTEWATAIMRCTKTAVEWINANRPLIQQALKIGAAMAAAGAALWVVGQAASVAAGAIGYLRMGLGLLGSAAMFAAATMKVLTTAITVANMASIFGSLGSTIAFLASPIGVVTVALAALAAWAAYCALESTQSLAKMGQLWVDLKLDAIGAWGDIVDAIKAGDLESAGKLAMALLNLEWVRTVQFLKQTWLDFKGFFVRIWTEGVFNVVDIAAETNALMETAWMHSVDFMKDAWAGFLGFVGKTYASTVGGLAKLLIDLNPTMSKEDKAGAKKNIDEDTARTTKRIDKGRDKEVFDRETARASEKTGIDARKKATLGDSAKEREGAQQAINKSVNSQIDAAAAAVAAARKELEDAKAEAREKRKANPGLITPVVKPGVEPELHDLAKKKFDVAGTFNAAGVGGLGVGKTAGDRTAENTAQTAAHLKKLLERRNPKNADSDGVFT